MKQMRLKWGILGTSMISMTIANAIRNFSLGELAAIGSRSFESAERFAKDFSISKYYASHQEVLDDDEVDVVYIGLPNHVHKDWIVRCALAGKHILCEKPLAVTLNEAEEAFSVVDGAGVFCMEALMYRCHPFIAKLKEVVIQKKIGEIKCMNAVYMANIADLANPIAGGSILNLGCYPVSLIRSIAGWSTGKNTAEPVAIQSIGRFNINQRDHQAGAVLKFENDIIASVNTADDMGMYHQFEIYGTKGHIRFITNPWLPTQDYNRFDIYTEGQESPAEINVTASKPLYSYQIDAVNRLILLGDKQSDFISWQDSLGNLAVLDTWLQQINATVKLNLTHDCNV